MGAIRSLPKTGWLAGLLCCVSMMPAAAGDVRSETVRFADPRWPAVQVIRGVPVAARPQVQVPRGAPSIAPPVFTATAANTELVTFGDGTGTSVKIVRGSSLSAPTPRIDAGRVETVRFAGFGASAVNIVRGGGVTNDGIGLFNMASGGELDRVAFAVDGAESGHGSNLAMWRPDFDGPQGPMQVSAAAALDVGGGDRFDMSENRALGRAFLAKMYQRYGNWPDAVAAYNWGPGHLDQWIANGRPTNALPLETARYMLKVLRDALLIGPSS